MLNEDEKYICVDKEREIALYYSKKLGKRRIYRQSYPLKPYIFNGKDINKGLILFKYRRKQNAQKLCDDINKSTGQNFQAIIEKEE